MHHPPDAPPTLSSPLASFCRIHATNTMENHQERGYRVLSTTPNPAVRIKGCSFENWREFAPFPSNYWRELATPNKPFSAHDLPYAYHIRQTTHENRFSCIVSHPTLNLWWSNTWKCVLFTSFYHLHWGGMCVGGIGRMLWTVDAEHMHPNKHAQSVSTLCTYLMYYASNVFWGDLGRFCFFSIISSVSTLLVVWTGYMWLVVVNRGEEHTHLFKTLKWALSTRAYYISDVLYVFEQRGYHSLLLNGARVCEGM